MNHYRMSTYYGEMCITYFVAERYDVLGSAIERVFKKIWFTTLRKINLLFPNKKVCILNQCIILSSMNRPNSKNSF